MWCFPQIRKITEEVLVYPQSDLISSRQIGLPHSSLPRTGWWYWLPALLVFVAGVAGMAATWMYSSRQVSDLAQERFMLRTDTVRSDLLQHVDKQGGLLIADDAGNTVWRVTAAKN